MKVCGDSSDVDSTTRDALAILLGFIEEPQATIWSSASVLKSALSSLHDVFFLTTSNSRIEYLLEGERNILTQSPLLSIMWCVIKKYRCLLTT